MCQVIIQVNNSKKKKIRNKSRIGMQCINRSARILFTRLLFIIINIFGLGVTKMLRSSWKRYVERCV